MINLFDAIYSLLGLDMFNATNIADFIPFFFRFLVSYSFLLTAIRLIFSSAKSLIRGGY